MNIGIDLYLFIARTIEKTSSSPECDETDTHRLYCYFNDLKDLLTLPEISFGFGGQDFPLDLKDLVNSCYLNNEAFFQDKPHSKHKYVCQMDLKVRKNHDSIGLPFFYRNLVMFDENTSSVGIVPRSNLSLWHPFSVSELINTKYMQQLKGKTHEEINALFKEKYHKHKKAGAKVVSSPDHIPEPR